MAKQTAGHHTGRFLDWLSTRLLSLIWVAIGLYGVYSIHTFVEDFETVGQRFLDLSQFLHNEMLEHDAVPQTESLRPNTQG